MSDENTLLPKKNPSGKIISSSQRQMIVNLYKAKLVQIPGATIRKYRQIISKELGIGEKTVSNTIAEYNNTKTVTSPSKKRIRISFRNVFDEFHRSTIRRHVHSFWFKRQLPTVDKLYRVVSNDNTLPSISRTDLFKLLKSMNFDYTERNQNNALIEKGDIVLWRRNYLEDLKSYREEGRHIYYLDETWINAGECTNNTCVDQTFKSSRDAFLQDITTGTENQSGKRLIALHIGSEDGFVPDGLLCFESKKNDFDDEMNENIFYEWMESILPRLKENCVIVMDNASYHSVKVEKIPTSTTPKNDIIKWVEGKGEVLDQPMVIPELLEIVKRIKPLYDKYIIDELAKEYGRTILRLPPYHCELNPIEQAWSSVKNYVEQNNTTYKLADVKVLLEEGINLVNSEMWTNFIKLTKKEERKCWKVDFIIDDVLEMLTAETTQTTFNIKEEPSSDTI
ncbi:Ribonuclease H-like domain,Winged helix-turn-helix DNA-binding domain [Cinara cedri]|uniref:Ribonuclease H-like domain,Winged helix-turn-helix DNA-binding domain n=1 Tax=Cinara cedri TaxID=506608 RepID=A0A5E4M8X9_9HEMI|nr:Ribonuclease H-like domain,Winged helix-turn-helix DNA-binding domain [Cinara cedri]